MGSNRTKLQTYALLLAIVWCAQPAEAQIQDLRNQAAEEPPAFVNSAHVLLHQKLEQGPIAAAVGPIPVGEGYATISYSIGTPGQRNNLSGWIKYLAQTLPGTIGNSDGTYVITLKLTSGAPGPNGAALSVKLPILSIQWTTQRAFLFFDKTINDISNTQWSGTLVDQMLITDANAKLTSSIEMSFHKNRSFDFSFLSQASNTGNAASLMSVLPLPAATVSVVNAVAGLVNNIYSNSTSEDVVDSDGIDVRVPSASVANIPVEASGQTVKIPVNITVSTKRSRLVEGGLTNGKFDKSRISQTLFEATQIVTSPGKSVSLAELMATADDARSKKTRAFLDALEKGAPYKTEDLSIRCGDFVAALDAYLSRADARAVFWAFLQRYSPQLDIDKCLGTGTLRPELTSMGLTF